MLEKENGRYNKETPQTKMEYFSSVVTQRPVGSDMMNRFSMKYLIYLIAIVIVTGILLVLIDTYVPFLPMNPVGPSITARSVKTFWPTDGENLIVPASKSPTVSPTDYSMSIQLMIGDSRANTSVARFRHIVHRGSNPCTISSGGGDAGPTGHAGLTMDQLPTQQDTDSYKQTGLPAVMNPGLFLDKYKNDLHVFVHTKSKVDNGLDVLLLESVTIEDVPIGEPLTVGIICNGKTLEVYLNCRLYSTLLLRGTPYLPKADNQWFGRYCTFPMMGLIKNLQLWDTAIGSTDYLAMCRAPSTSTFKKSDLTLPMTHAQQQQCTADAGQKLEAFGS